MAAEIPPPTNPVTVTDVDMPFWSMVRFMVKWAFASIPALILIILFTVAIWAAIFAGFAAIGLGGAALMGAASPSPTASPTPSSSPRIR